jgi:hypothetical protein
MTTAFVKDGGPLPSGKSNENKVAFAARVYARKGFTDEDFQRGAARQGMCIVKGIRPPEVVGGIHTDAAWDKIPGTMLMLYEVVDVAAEQPSFALKVKPGDVVLLRTAHLDPLQPDGKYCAIFTKHLLRIMNVPKE